MVRVNIVKLSNWRIPRQFMERWLMDLAKMLKKEANRDTKGLELTIAFVEKRRIKNLNQDFRQKAKTTDILSFSGLDEDSLGELVLCGDIVDQQAIDHKLKRNEELGYLLIHGVLHLLGYQHEQGGKAEKEMFDLQDRLFGKLQKKHF